MKVPDLKDLKVPEMPEGMPNMDTVHFVICGTIMSVFIGVLAYLAFFA